MVSVEGVVLEEVQSVWSMLVSLRTPNADAERHRRDPAAWARERLGAHLWSKQVDIAESVSVNRRTAVKSCHGVGKSWTAGMLAAWWVDVHPVGEAIVVSTAPSYKQVHAVLWEEIRKQHKLGDLAGTVTLTDEWKIDGQIVGMGRKPADHDQHGFQGIHRRYVLVIIDEACGVPTNLYTAVEAITTNADCRILAIGNPDDPNTEFGKICNPGSGWNVLRIASQDSPNFTGEEVPDALRHLLPTEEWVSDAAKRWGTDSPLYTSKVLGEFPEISENNLIPASWVVRAQNRWEDSKPGLPTVIGVDVARYGSDKTVLMLQEGLRAHVEVTLGSSSIVETTNETARLLLEYPGAVAHVDDSGIGGGVTDLLLANNWPCSPIISGSTPSDPVRYKNARAEWYWGLRQLFQDDLIAIDPADDELASQLTSIRYKYTERGQVQIESKEDMANRKMPSPDRADALMMAFATPPPPPAPVEPEEFEELDARGYVYSPY